MATKSFLEVMSAYRVIQGIICEVRSKVDDLHSDARALYEAATTPEDEAPSYMLMEELEALSDVLSSWEGEDQEEIQR
jgi:hypothetical protein